MCKRSNEMCKCLDVSRCAMDGNLLNYFSKQLVTELNGLALLQVLCSATFTYTLHTVDVHIQKLISVEPCPSVHQLSQHLTAHSNRMAVLLHMNALGDGIMARFLQIGVFKRMCEKLPVAFWLRCESSTTKNDARAPRWIFLPV